jgi:hypothetical protein
MDAQSITDYLKEYRSGIDNYIYCGFFCLALDDDKKRKKGL